MIDFVIERQMAAEVELLRGLREDSPDLRRLRAFAAAWDRELAAAARAALESGVRSDASDGPDSQQSTRCPL